MLALPSVGRYTQLLLTLLAITLSIATASTNKEDTTATTPQTRVVGGSTVRDAAQFPYFAQLPDASCAAVLIHDDYLLTAAHCERPNHPFYRRVLLNSVQVNEGIERTIESIRAHPAYLPALQDYDFVLYKLTSSALVDDNGEPTGVQVISVNRNATIPQPGDPLQAMGFGKLRETSAGMHTTMQQVQIEYMENEVCRKQYGADQFWDHIMFCAGVAGGGKDTCQGDSGGPIVDIKSGALVGMVSYGIGCARPQFFGVNARVSSVVEWIEAELCRGSDYPPDYCWERPDYVPKENSTSDSNETGGAMTVFGTLDDYPKEFAWSLTYLGASNATTTPQPTEQELFLSLPETFTKNGAAMEQSFDKLRPGYYDLQFGDNGLDGICCGFGKGELSLVNDLTGETVWTHNGRYRGYLQTRIQIDDTGNIQVLFENKEYQPSWERLEATNYPPSHDPEWPGPLPDEPLFSFNVNFKFDAYPKENEYQIYYLEDEETLLEHWDSVAAIDEDDWKEVDSLKGEDQEGVNNIVVPRRLVNQQPGWYWLKVQDSKGDGICCDYRRGWISLTAPIITTWDVGLVWGNNGEFGKGVNVYFYMNTEGYIAHVTWMVDSEATATERGAAKGAKEKGVGGRRLRARPFERDEYSSAS